MSNERVSFILNGEEVILNTDPAKSLLHILREDLALLGTKEGCGRGECGACTVLFNGLPVNACLLPAGKLNGSLVVTIEGISGGASLHPVQESFIEEGAVQCGYCTSGMIMTAVGFLKNNPGPTIEETREAISGNICRCSGYKQIEKAVMRAAVKLKSPK